MIALDLKESRWNENGVTVFTNDRFAVTSSDTEEIRSGINLGARKMAKRKDTNRGVKRLSSKNSTRRRPEALKPDEATVRNFSFLTDFLSYPWDGIPQRSAFGVYALCVFANYSDYGEIADIALTEGGDDRCVDFFYYDAEEMRVFIGQNYVAESWNLPAAPSSKADDLLTGLSWLLNRNLDEVPSTIRDKARELQQAIDAKQVRSVYLLFTHNCRESTNVETSLKRVRESAKTLLESDSIVVEARELGLARIQEHYDALSKRMLVESEVDFECAQYFEEEGAGWRAVSTTVSGEQISDLWNEHGDKLFSANVRGFLDMLGRRTSINRGMLETIQHEPTCFWAYNNGITILTKKITLQSGRLTATGISIINGAQTTGVIGSAPLGQAKLVRVPCRFIECNDTRIIENIIERNNTQNEIRSFDLRSNDPTQRHLGQDFRRFGIEYLHRREGARRMPLGAIQAEVVGPYLAAFHGLFQIATRERRKIFEDRSLYEQVFQKAITAGHVYLVQCLADAVSRLKRDYQDINDSGNSPKGDDEIHEVMKHSPSKFFIVAVIGELAEVIWGRRVSSRYNWAVAEGRVKPERDDMIRRWRIVLDALMPLIATGINGDAYETVRSRYGITESAKKVRALVGALKNQFQAEFSALRDATEMA